MKSIVTTLTTEAIFSDDGLKRYLLRKTWVESKPKLAIVMLAPSEASGIALDTTTQLVLNNASRLGFGRVDVLNLFATLNDFSLKQAESEDSVNLDAIQSAAADADAVVYAPGVGKTKNKLFQLRQAQVLAALLPFESKLQCLTNANGKARFQHPLSPAVRIWYQGCEDRIWRELQISSNAPLSQLGYTVLSTFDTLAYHLFSISYDGDSYELPDEDIEISENECLFCVKLSDLNLQIGSKLEMVYDFGCEQEFFLEVTDIQPMKKGAGRAYPKITSGAGFGIIDDMPAEELLELIQDIDKNGSSLFYYEAKRPEVVWDYRKYDMKLDNLLLKGEIEEIADGYSAFEAYL